MVRWECASIAGRKQKHVDALYNWIAVSLRIKIVAIALLNACSVASHRCCGLAKSAGEALRVLDAGWYQTAMQNS